MNDNKKIRDMSEYTVDFADIKYERKSIEKILWGYSHLDWLTKGIPMGLNILVADTNMGKTVFTSSLIMNAIHQKYKSCVFASEHTIEDYKNLIMQQNGRTGQFEKIPFIDNNGYYANFEDFYVNKSVEDNVSYMLNHRLFLYDTYKKERDVNSLIDWIEWNNKENGCKFCIIDNAMEIDLNSQNELSGQTQMLTKLRDTFLRLGMFGILIMHINKESAVNGFRLNVKSASGTSNAGNKAYNVIALYRKDCIYVGKNQEKMLDKFKQDVAINGFDYENCNAFIEVLKTKGNGNGIVGLNYDIETKRYSQSEQVSKVESVKLLEKYKKLEYENSDYCDFDDLEPINEELPFNL